MNFTVFSKPACPFCDQAKSLLRSKKLQYTEIILDVGQEKDPTAQYISRSSLLEQIPAARSMPQIMINDKAIGGFTELKSFLQINAAN